MAKGGAPTCIIRAYFTAFIEIRNRAVDGTTPYIANSWPGSGGLCVWLMVRILRFAKWDTDGAGEVAR